MVPSVSIIIVNFNGLAYLQECLSSVYAQAYDNFKVVFVDNGSTDDSVAFVKKNFPKTRIIVNSGNTGFAEGNNVGIKATESDYIVTLNNDTRVAQNWLKELVMAADADSAIGCCQSKMVRYSDPTIIDSAGIQVFLNGLVIDRGSGEKDCGLYDRQEEIFGVCAGAALYRAAMLDEIGLFPSWFFVSYEDVDLAWRAKYAGWKAMYVPASVVYHVRQATQKHLYRERKPFWAMKRRNQLYCCLKYLPVPCLLKNIFSLCYMYALLVMISLMSGAADCKKAAWLLPRAFMDRRRFQSRPLPGKRFVLQWLNNV